ncbi:MAG: hypothetical protein FJX54_04770 [Alphaproteobacteria bacterium]|nr:hypothetical protein [Alphaproteobacteria bacterium]
MESGHSPIAAAGPLPPDPMSDACARFFRTHAELWRFIGFVSDLALRVDDMARLASEAVPPGVSGRPVGGGAAQMPSAEGAMARTLRGQRHVFLHMVLSRVVDSYIAYVAELTVMLAVNNPRALGPGEGVPLELLVEHDSIDEVVDAIVRDRVFALAASGLDALEAWVGDRFGFALFVEDEVRDRVARLIDVHNLIARHRGLATRRFAGADREGRQKPGQPIELAVDQLFSDSSLLARSVTDIDVRAADQFDLPRAVSPSLPIG